MAYMFLCLFHGFVGAEIKILSYTERSFVGSFIWMPSAHIVKVANVLVPI